MSMGGPPAAVKAGYRLVTMRVMPAIVAGSISLSPAPLPRAFELPACDLVAPVVARDTVWCSRKFGMYMFLLAGGLGFEPRQAESESAVLPLDDPPRPRGHAELQCPRI